MFVLTSFSLVSKEVDKNIYEAQQRAAIKNIEINGPKKCVKVKFESDKRNYKVCL